MHAHLPGILQVVAPFLDNYGYVAVGAFLILEDFGVPVPGETILIAGAVYAGTGQMNVFLLAVIAIVSAVIGDNIGFAIGHYGGERLVLKYGRYVFITPKRLDMARDFFNKRGGVIIIVARYIDGLRQLNGIIAGTAEMKWRRFLLYNVIGATLWVGTWVTIGYLAGNHIDAIYGMAKQYELFLLGVVVLALIAFVVRHIIRKRRGNRR